MAKKKKAHLKLVKSKEKPTKDRVALKYMFMMILASVQTTLCLLFYSYLSEVVAKTCAILGIVYLIYFTYKYLRHVGLLVDGKLNLSKPKDTDSQ